MLDKLRIAQYQLTMTAREPIYLPEFQGNVWRGGFGAVFRRVVCAQEPQIECTECLLRENCAYVYIFATPIPRGAAVLRTQEAAPRPFVLAPAGEHRAAPVRYAAGEQLTVGLTLIGRAVEYLPYFIVVFQELGAAGIGRGRGRYELTAVHAVRQWTDEKLLIYRDGAVRADAGDMLEVGYAEVMARARVFTSVLHHSDARRITVKFVTPTRLKSGGRYVQAPEFHELVRGLLRRVSTLYYFHCGEQWVTDYRGLATRAESVRIGHAATRWVTQERYSRRQRRSVGLSGFVGAMEYEGELGEFIPLLLIGELVHVGKGAVFSNGQYEIQMSGEL